MLLHGKCTLCGNNHSIHYDCRNPFQIKPQSKFLNKKTVVNGIQFHSQKEAQRYRELSLLQQKGVIKNLTLQPVFRLQDGFTYRGKKERPINYIADFQYFDTQLGHDVVEDVKASIDFKTDVYKMKRKLFLYKYKGVYEFREIY